MTTRRQNQFTTLLLAFLLATLSTPQAAAELTRTERRFLELVEPIALASIDDFTPLPRVRAAGIEAGYRYQLAFLSYGVVSLAHADPTRQTHYHHLFDRLLAKMEHPTTRAYWKEFGYRGDGESQDNIMYRGHLALMYALARHQFGDTRFDEKFGRLARDLHQEMTSSKTGGICCEPDQLFIQCNAVALLALHLHDRLHGTGYANAGHKLLNWAHRNMPIAGTRLVRDNFRLRTGSSSRVMAGYANAWAITFLGPIPAYREEALAMFRDWKRTFVLEGPGLALARGKPGWPSTKEAQKELASAMLSTFFGVLAAREAGDDRLHRRLGRLLSPIEAIRPALSFLDPQPRKIAHLALLISLHARTFRGWSTLLADPPHEPR